MTQLDNAITLYSRIELIADMQKMRGCLTAETEALLFLLRDYIERNKK